MRKVTLNNFTLEELEAEIARRKKGILPLSDFYFMPPDDTDEDDIVFLIIHKRRWHLEHCTDDGVYDNIINEGLPKDFDMIQESTCRYLPKRKKEPTLEEAIHVMSSAGAEYIEEPYWNDTVTSNKKLYIIEGVRFHLAIHVDNEKIKNDFLKWDKKTKTDYVVEYIKELGTWAESKKLHLEQVTSSVVSLVEKKVWEKLPPFPEPKED